MAIIKSKFPKLNPELKSILYNRWILYFISILAIADFIYLCGISDWFSVVVFATVGFLVTFFNKNMIVVFSIAMSITHILKYGVQGVRVHEGFEDSEESSLKGDNDDEVKKVDSEKPVINKVNDKKTEKKEDEKEEKKTKVQKYMELKKEFPEFKEIQKEILNGVEKMNPLLEKAENFIEKFNDYKSVQ